MLQIVFLCLTCERRNQMELDRPNFTPWQTKFESLTDVWKHLYETHRNNHDNIHEVMPEIVNTDDQ